MPTLNSETRNIRSFDDWLKGLGVTRVTGHRWRRNGMIKTFRIFRKLYVSAEEIAKFEASAIEGKYAQEPVVPDRSATAQRSNRRRRRGE
ncbi:MAG TPA: hypothetical protein VGM54_13675 [Chthoniobacter sp.]|jgi:predicted site-specific integrase-resolvase